MCKAWEINEDATEFTFHLREGMKWSDGEPFTADDFLFWYEDCILNADLTPTIPSWLRDPNNEAAGAHEGGRLHLHDHLPESLRPFPADDGRAFGDRTSTTRPSTTCSSSTPSTPRRKTWTSWSGRWLSRTGSSSSATKRSLDQPRVPDRSAPGILKRVPPDLPIVGERNPYYWKVDPEGNQLPYIDRPAVRHRRERRYGQPQGLAGEDDMQTRAIALDQLPAVRGERREGRLPGLSWSLGSGSNALIYPNLNHRTRRYGVVRQPRLPYRSLHGHQPCRHQRAGLPGHGHPAAGLCH